MKPFAIARAGAKPSRILIVDDDRHLLDLMRELLEERGYRVDGLHTAENAHSVIATERPDLVILDLKLGSSEAGWGVLDAHILDPATRTIPVVLCSGQVESIRARSAALLPEYKIGVLTKPFDIDSLLSVVQEALNDKDTRPARVATPAEPSHPLSPREVEVARLVAQGHTNADIAEALFLSKGTARNHVEHILQKLGLSNRAQIATWVATHLNAMEQSSPAFDGTLTRAPRLMTLLDHVSPDGLARRSNPEPPRAS